MVVIFVGKYSYNGTIYLKVDGHGSKSQFDQKKVLCLYQTKFLENSRYCSQRRSELLTIRIQWKANFSWSATSEGSTICHFYTVCVLLFLELLTSLQIKRLSYGPYMVQIFPWFCSAWARIEGTWSGYRIFYIKGQELIME